MLGRARSVWPLALALALPVASPGLVAADEEASGEGWEDEVDDDDDDDFDTSWFGVRVGAWYRPSFNMDAQISGNALGGLSGLLGNTIDVERELGLTENPKSDYLVDFDGEAVLELEAFFHTSLIDLSVWWIAPFEYTGSTTVTRDFNFGGVTFTASDDVESRFRQWFVGTDLAINVFNNRYFRVSPLVSIRAIGIDWEVKDSLGAVSGDTSDIASPLEYEGYQVFPHPEVGVHLAVGYRDYFDVSLKLAGSIINYFDIEGSSLRVEAAATFYPIPYLGLQVGARSLQWHLESASDDPDEQFDIDMDFIGWTAAIIIRLG